MNLKRMVCASTLAAGVGVAGLLGVGLGTAGADPGCGGWNQPQCGGPGWHDNNNGPGWNNNNNNGPGWNNNNNNNNGPVDWQHRNIDQARQDHQAFQWMGQQVQPMQAGNGPGWGFWFLGQWIPL
jgi:hypothetical protein